MKASDRTRLLGTEGAAAGGRRNRIAEGQRVLPRLMVDLVTVIIAIAKQGPLWYRNWLGV